MVASISPAIKSANSDTEELLNIVAEVVVWLYLGMVKKNTGSRWGEWQPEIVRSGLWQVDELEILSINSDKQVKMVMVIFYVFNPLSVRTLT